MSLTFLYYFTLSPTTFCFSVHRLFEFLNFEKTDRDLFLNARKENIATYQHIVMYEWLPLLLGNKYIHSHKLHSYKAAGSYNHLDIDARVANEFASVAFRFGHSQVTDTLKRLNKNLKTCVVKTKFIFRGVSVLDNLHL